MKVNFMGDHEVEDVVRPLTGWLVGHTRFLKQVNLNISTSHLSHVVEPDSDELSKSRRIIISDSLSISIGFKNWIGLDNLVFKGDFLLVTFFNLFSCSGTNKGKVGDDLLGIFRFTSSGLPSDQNWLVFALCDKIMNYKLNIEENCPTY